MARLCATTLVVALVLVAGCGDDPTTVPDDGGDRLSVGGGRQGSEDPLIGGADGSGPANPDFDPPSGDFYPLFYSDQDCQQNPSLNVIRDQTDWQAWWSAATDCLRGIDDPPPPIRHLLEGDPSDSGVVTPEDPYPVEAPEVDFANHAVVTIALEPDSGFGRSVWIQDVTSSPTGSVVRYLVSELGDDCLPLIMAPYVSGLTAPTIAVTVPLPFDEPIDWQREENVYDCTWEPDPNEPIALYYTDADCELGAGEMLLTDAATFEAWISTALACDGARWFDSDGTGVPGDTGGGDPSDPNDPTDPTDPKDPTDPTTPPGSWAGMQVDFTTHAVIVLRAEPQNRWGGGIWLSGLEKNAGGTTIDYTIMTPGEDCPLIEEGEMLQPTVAIRVPLPLDAPVTWTRHVETIGCAWGEGDPGGVDSTGVPTPGR